MATAFDVAMSAIFADANMATPATYRAGGYGLAVTVPVLMRAPEVRQGWNEVAISSASVIIEVQVAKIAAPASGDTFTIGAKEYVVQGAPERDAAQVVWVIELVENT